MITLLIAGERVPILDEDIPVLYAADIFFVQPDGYVLRKSATFAKGSVEKLAIAIVRAQMIQSGKVYGDLPKMPSG